MGNQPRDWMVAAACAEGPAPSVTFSDLPRERQGELARVAMVAAVSTAYFVTVGILAAPLPSRSLVGNGALPDPGGVRPIVLEARLAPTPAPVAPVRSSRVVRSRPDAVTLATLRESAGDARPAPTPPRRNPLTRFFRGVFRTLQPTRSQADSL
jgi:hypothetical protein